MSIYNFARVRELAIEKMKKDLGKQGYNRENKIFKTDEDYTEFYSLDKTEFHNYMILHNIVRDINEWTFYTSDSIYDEILTPNKPLYQMYEHFDIDECLEEAKSERIIDGFIELGGDLWLVKD